jgi:hypothetical protein
VIIYYPLNITDGFTLRYTLDGSPVTNSSLAFTNATELSDGSPSYPSLASCLMLTTVPVAMAMAMACDAVVWRTTTVRARVFPPLSTAAWLLPSEETEARYLFSPATTDAASNEDSGICGDMTVRWEISFTSSPPRIDVASCLSPVSSVCA